MKTTSLPYGYKMIAIGDDHFYLTSPKDCPNVHAKLVDGSWYITRSDERIPDALERVPYPTAETALVTGLEICRAHDRMMKAYSVPKPLQEAIERAERSVREQERDLRSLNSRAAFGRWEIESLRKVAGMPPTNWDTDDLVKRLNEVSFDDKHPFFSEATLYDLLGKEDARTVLALIGEAKKRLDPIGGAL